MSRTKKRKHAAARENGKSPSNVSSGPLSKQSESNSIEKQSGEPVPEDGVTAEEILIQTEVGCETPKRDKKRKKKEKKVARDTKDTAGAVAKGNGNLEIQGPDTRRAEDEPDSVAELVNGNGPLRSIDTPSGRTEAEDTEQQHRKQTETTTSRKKSKKDRWGGAVESKLEEEGDTSLPGETSIDGTDDLSNEEMYEPKKIYVGGMPYTCTEQDIMDLFADCGKVTELDCVLFPDTGRFRGLAFLTFETEEGARNALELDCKEVGGRTLKVTRCKIRAPRRGAQPEVEKYDGCLSAYVGNLAWNVTDNLLKKLLIDNYRATKLESIRLSHDTTTGEFRGFGHLDFKDDASLEAALKLNGKSFLGRQIRVAYSVPKKVPPITCHSCGKEGHKVADCQIKGPLQRNRRRH